MHVVILTTLLIFSDDFKFHIEHLHAILWTLSKLGMILSLDKCYIGFHSVQLLGHVVNQYELFTLPEKVSAVASIKFPKHLKDLELFIDLSDYYCHFIAQYAELIKPLQKCKTIILNGIAYWDKNRLSHTKKIKNPMELKIISFQLIKDVLCSFKLLIHHDQKLLLLVYVNSSIEGGFATAIHQVSAESMKDKQLSVKDVLNGRHNRKLEKPVTYLFRMLNKHKVNYWLTELEITEII